MTIALVHGNPETERIWDPLVAALGGRRVVCLSPPGFGAPAPAGWRANPAAYVEWLTAELEAIGEPVDLLGHDLGGVHALGVAMTRPDLLRTWCVDSSIGVFDAEFSWHALAKVWQAPEVGEEAVAALLGRGLAERTAYLISIRVPAGVAPTLAAGLDAVSGQAILDFYRSAREPALAELAQQLPAARRRPGLVLLAAEDNALGNLAVRRRAASAAGARDAELSGLGHWWMLENPIGAAAILTDFWDAQAV